MYLSSSEQSKFVSCVTVLGHLVEELSVATMNAVVVDIECFRYRKEEWIVKEIAVCGDYLDSIIVKPPYNMNMLDKSIYKAYRWLTSNLHHLDWDSGDYSYSQLVNFINSIKLRYPNAQFFTKGFEKRAFLEQIFKAVFIDLDDLNCPQIKDLTNQNEKFTCPHTKSNAHSESNHCARKKVKYYSDWLKHNVPPTWNI